MADSKINSYHYDSVQFNELYTIGYISTFQCGKSKKGWSCEIINR